jgi:hypothetical protein
MKKLLIVLPFILFGIIGCNKSGTVDNLNNYENLTNTQQVVLKEPNEDLQRNMFRLLSAEEKSQLFITKYANILKNENLNALQVAFVKKIQAFVSPAMYKSNTKPYVEADIKAEALSLFGIKKATRLLASLDTRLDAATMDEFSDVNTPNCHCSTGSDWCGSSTFCSTSVDCKSKGGCGTFWTWTCNGICYFK